MPRESVVTIGFVSGGMLCRVLEKAFNAVTAIPECVDFSQQCRRRCRQDFEIAIPIILDAKGVLDISRAFHGSYRVTGILTLRVPLHAVVAGDRARLRR